MRHSETDTPATLGSGWGSACSPATMARRRRRISAMPTRNCFRRLSMSCRHACTLKTICGISLAYVAALSALLRAI